jgi:hypothetical protein
MRWLLLVFAACGDNLHGPADAPADATSDCTCSLPNAVTACTNGMCAITSCVGGTADCDGIADNGCETPVITNANCGACGSACDPGATCSYVGCAGDAPAMSCVAPSTGICQTSGPDSDGDGLLDAWELAGYIDVNCNGVMDADGIDVWLPDAHVNVPDLYIEIDHLERPSDSCTPGPCTTCTIDDDCAAIPGEQCGAAGVCVHTHAPKQASIDAVTAALQRALPATPPGIYLHVDTAHASAIPETGRTVVSYGTNFADPTDRVLDPTCTGPDAVDFYDLKDQFYFTGPGGPSSLYAQVRRRVYHYALFVHYSSCQPGPPGNTEQYCTACPKDRGGFSPKSGSTGTSETPGNDLMVSLGAYLFDVGLPLTVNTEGGTFLHELGHNLGLGHGVRLDGSGNPVPAPDPNRSPNYLSVMNYNYQTLGVPVANAPGVGTASTFKVQYSDIGTCAPLDEDALDETAGAQCGATSAYVLYWTSGDFAGSAPGGFHHASTTTGTPINWNFDAGNVLDTSVAVDLNNDTVHQTHYGLNDWAYDAAANRLLNLRTDTSCYQWTLLDGAPPPAAMSASEQSAAEIARFRRR